MKLEIHTGNQTGILEGSFRGEDFHALWQGKSLDANLSVVAPGVYSVLLGEKSFEVRVTPEGETLRVQAGESEFRIEIIDPRAWRRAAGALEAEGRQQVRSPMPGKVIRLLAHAGDSLEAGQGILVMEAMKMQNEVRSPKTGEVERLLVKEGQSVNAGDILATIA